MNLLMIFLPGLLFLATAFTTAAEQPDIKASPPATATTNAASERVIAYYFHGNIRCETCLKIEKQAREVIERRYQPELTARRLVFEPANYDQPENQRYWEKYKLACPSLVIVRHKDGVEAQWKLLGETWQLIGEAAKFDRYVEDEVGKYLRDAK
jgi:hypothetical protein